MLFALLRSPQRSRANLDAAARQESRRPFNQTLIN
jgi:hypothetical protein